MKRLVALLAVVFCLGQTAGAFACLVPASCEQGCPDDGPNGECFPLCTGCLCCPHLQPVVLASLLLPLASEPVRIDREPAAHPSPAAPSDEIFHVPESPRS